MVNRLYNFEVGDIVRNTLYSSKSTRCIILSLDSYYRYVIRDVQNGKVYNNIPEIYIKRNVEYYRNLNIDNLLDEDE